MRVQKRDGKLQPFDEKKIVKAILAAFNDVQPGNIPDLSSLIANIAGNINENYHDIISIDEIQREVEKSLRLFYPLVGENYTKYRLTRDELRRQRTVFPGSAMIADYIHNAKYARHLPDLKRRETFKETVDRVKLMHIQRYASSIISKIVFDIIEDAFKYVYVKQVLPSMRSMQFAGSAITNHNARMYNCSYTLIDRQEVFGEILYLLLCGCGVGYSVQFQHVEKLFTLSHIKRSIVKHFVIPDTIEGWADAVSFLILSYKEGFYAEYSYNKIRPEGSPLVTSGGKAPGHLGLKHLLETIRGLLDKAQGRQLRPIECHDIICHIAEAVLAGGIRRSSLIALFSREDGEMTYCKDKNNFQFNGINSQRAMANNSVVFNRREVTKEQFFRLMKINKDSYGEPGFVFVNDYDEGTNPCGEIGLYPKLMTGETGFGFCNLVEVNVAACKTQEQFLQACRSAAIIATLQAGYAKFPYLSWVTEEIAKRDALIGVGLTGIMDNPAIGLNKACLNAGAALVLDINAAIAKLIGINPSSRCTCIKPGGTAPLELGCVSSGIHPHHARRYFRRITANPNEAVAQYFRSKNPQMIETKPNGDWCITFPVEIPSDAITLKNVDALQFVNNVLDVYENWVLWGTRGWEKDTGEHLTHNVSATVVIELQDWEVILQHVWDNKNRVKSMTFLPASSDKNIPFCPREEVINEADEMLWNYLITNYRPVDYTKMIEDEGSLNYGLEPACGGGSCGI